MSEMTVTVRTFEMDTDKVAALKPLEEAAEVYGAWQVFHVHDKDTLCKDRSCVTCEWNDVCEDVDGVALGHTKAHLADELADCITACCNLAARYGIDMDRAMERCEERNRERERDA